MQHRTVPGWVMGIVAAVLVQAAAVPPTTHAQEVSYSGSAQYSTGSYIFSERTHSLYLSNGLSVSANRLSLSASVPIIVQSSPWVSYTAVGAVPSGGPQSGAVRRRDQQGGGQGPGHRPSTTIALPDTATYNDVGLGDPSLRADIELIESGSLRPGIQLAVGAKAPLADVDRGFGTGAWDAGLGAALSNRWGSWFLFAEAMHWWMGDMDDLPLENAVAYSIALGRSLKGGTVGLLTSLSGYTTEIVDGIDPPLQGAFGISYLFSGGRYGLNGSASFGLTESAPNASVALGWRVTL